jgi:hypothetical protein
MTARNDSQNNKTPGNWQLQYSDDNSTWTTKASVTSNPWPAGGTQTFNFGETYSITGANDWTNLAVFEISGATMPLTTSKGACSGGSSTLTTGSLSAATSGSLRMILMEWDFSAPGATTPSGWTLLTPVIWQKQTDSLQGNHCSALWMVPTSISGAQTITMSPASGVGNSIWADIQIPAAATTYRQMFLACGMI